MQDIYKPAKEELSTGIGIIKNITQSRSNPLDIIREALSNSCSREVNASYFKITIFHDVNYGWSMVFEDDGIGMEYSGSREPEKQKRLNRFLDLSYSGLVGNEADEFGYKGLGSKLMYFCRKLDIETRTKNGPSYKILVNEPYDRLIEHKKPESPKPVIFKNIPVGFDHGTVIKVYGYNGGTKLPEYEDPEKLHNYLFFRTLVGHTNSERLREGFPKIILKTPAIPEEELIVGFPWINSGGDHVEGQRTGMIREPIVVKKQNKNGDEVTITLKGGYALKPDEYDMNDEGVLESKGVGLLYSWRGIPYFNLDFNLYKPKGFGLNYRFCRFVVECDDVEMDITGSNIVAVPGREQLFIAALKEGYQNLMETDEYIEWMKYKSEAGKKVLSKTLDQRKQQLLGKEQRWVYYKDNLLYKEPENAHDVHVLLWKLEGMDVMPMYYFRTLEHTAQKEIDIIADYQEKDNSRRKEFIAVEVEYILENYGDSKYIPGRASLIIAWDSNNRDSLIKTDREWKYVWEYTGIKLDVILLKYIPSLHIKSNKPEL